MEVSKTVRSFEKLQIKIIYVVQLVKLNSYVPKHDHTVSLLH
jgi:hypothetical protein